MRNIISQQVKNFIRHHDLIRSGQHVLVAVSGGADSVALLGILLELARPMRLRLTVAHLNHKIRGKDAEEDARFVRQLARRLHLDFAGGNADVPRLAGRLGISLEMAGRRVRYGFFEKTAMARRCDLVATAHTADDNAETMLLMLTRGCGLQGLTGIAPKGAFGKITVIRPLLSTSREAIEKYLRGRKISWREDLSNLDSDFLRNRVRHELLPLLEAKFNKGIKETLNRMSVVLREENDFIEHVAQKAYSEACIDHLMNRKAKRFLDSRFHGNDRLDACICLSAALCTALQAGHSRLDPAFVANRLTMAKQARESRIHSGRPELNARQLTKYHIAVRRRVLRHWLKASGVNPEAIDYQSINRIDDLLARSGRGRAINLAGGITIRRNYQRLEIGGQGTEPGKKYRHKISVPGRTILPETGLIVRAKIGPGVCRARAVFGSFPVSASLSLRKWNKRRILVRPWRPGDRVRSYGLGGSKKIQDIFSDAKVPVTLRTRLPVFECGGEIIWIPGYRIAEGWQVGNSAENALQLTVRLMTRRL